MDKWNPPVRKPPVESPLVTVSLAVAGVIAGITIPTAFAIWMGWLDPLFR